ncbi:uncharacterized protein LOC125664063 [Ostrea edulis]|uniref:uncharacterized protein LOC125664063 n=1 Tax=Ostrea edulis TaxID=37623 RepID=UPI0024AF7E1E|nr:uncharacterized protein LOC125664063 [Ostrea edulis]
MRATVKVSDKQTDRTGSTIRGVVSQKLCLWIFVTSQHLFNHTNVNENTQVVQKYPWLIQRTNYQLQCTSCGIPVIQCNRCTCESESFCSECTRVLTPSYQTLLPGTIMEYWCSCVEKTQEVNSSDSEFNLQSQNGERTFEYPGQINQAFLPENCTGVSNGKTLQCGSPPYQNTRHVSPPKVVYRFFVFLEKSINYEKDLDLFLRSKGVHKERRVSSGSRKFYEYQDKLIEGYEEVAKNSNDKYTRLRKLQKKTNLYAKISFAANLILLAAKLVAAVLSGSMAIISSLVDSVVDLASGIVVWVTTRAVRKTDSFKYPNGRHLLEPLAVILLSVIMGMASLQLIKEAAGKITALSSGSTAPPTVDYVTISISGMTIVLKLALFLLCRRIKTPTVQALAQDHRNDVLSNTLAIVCGYIGSREIQDELGEGCLIYVDPIGAITISLYIAVTWYITGRDQTKLLTGFRADPVIISKLIWTCMNHHRFIESVNHVSAYHVGYDITVEMAICVSAELPNYKAQEVKDSLKSKLEKIDKISKVYINMVSYCDKQCSRL